MTATKQEQILEYVTTLAAATTGVSGRVYRSRPEAFARAETPCILIEPIQDPATYNVIDFMNWQLVFKTTIITRGTTPDTLADPIKGDLYARLMADRSLGGLAFDIIPVGIYFNIIDGDLPIGETEMQFQVTYRTSASDLTH